MKYSCSLALAGLALLAPGATHAAGTYQIQAIATTGTLIGDTGLKTEGGFAVGALNDQGQLVFVAGTGVPSVGQALIQYAGGHFTPLVTGGGDAPGGTWPRNIAFTEPVAMNQAGHVLFGASILSQGQTDSEAFLWDNTTGRLAAITPSQTPLAGGRTLEGSGGPVPALNNRDEIAFIGGVKGTSGPIKDGLFFLSPGLPLTPAALPGDALPDGGTLAEATWPSINDSGLIAFLAQRHADPQGQLSAYLWEKGTLTPLLRVGDPLPGGGKVVAIGRALVNDQNRSVLVQAFPSGGGASGLYRWSNGQLAPVLLPGQALDATRTLQSIQSWGISGANERGQHVIMVQLNGGATAAYRLDPNGQLTLLLASGSSTPLGPITHVGLGADGSIRAAINSQGQVALSVQFKSGPDTLVLLTPATP